MFYAGWSSVPENKLTLPPVEVCPKRETLHSLICGCGSSHPPYMWTGQRNYQSGGKIWLSSCLIDWAFSKIKELESKVGIK